MGVNDFVHGRSRKRDGRVSNPRDVDLKSSALTLQFLKNSKKNLEGILFGAPGTTDLCGLVGKHINVWVAESAVVKHS